MSAIYYKGQKYTGPTLNLGSGSLTTDDKTIVGGINEINSSISILNTALEDKQNTLVSGTNIKTINNTSLLGSGNIEVSDTALANRVTTLETEQAVLDARMDTFASLTEGSTTGDAELTDIRVGANGETYPSAGDAVRAQITGLQDEVDALFNVVTAHSASYETSYQNALQNAFVWVVSRPIPAGAASVELGIMVNSSLYAGPLTVVFLRKNSNGTYSVIAKKTMTTVSSTALNKVDIPDAVTFSEDVYVGFYSNGHGMAYSNAGETETMTRFAYSDIESSEITMSGSFTLNFSYMLTYKTQKESGADGAGVVVVSKDGTGNYTDIVTAMNSEPEGTVIFIKPGVYEQDMTGCLEKRLILIGADRNQCIIRDTDGRYGHHALYVSCGYFENLTIEEPYVSGVSQEVGVSDLGAYAVHIDNDNDYGVGKQIEFHHCNISSDFFPAIGAGLRKDMTMIVEDCWLKNGQISGRGDYSDEGSLGALYFHDSNGTQGDQYVKLNDNVMTSKLANVMCVYQVDRSPQNNSVHCDFVNNVLYSDAGKYSNTVWFRNNPFNETTGIFDIGVGFGNSIDSLNNN